jgi:LysM repeat protein
MKKIITLSLVFVSVVITGCKPNNPPLVTHPATIVTNFVTLIVTNVVTLPVDTHPAILVGNWKAEFTPVKEADVTIGITTETNGKAVFGEQATYTIARGDTLATIARANSVTVNQILKANPGLNEVFLPVGNKILIQAETISGSWKQTDDYLIIERPNGGFVAFRISSQSTNQLTVFARTGQTIQFNRIP